MGFSGSAPENKPAAPAATQEAAPVAVQQNDDIIAVIAAAIAACGGASEQIAHIVRLNGGKGWTNYSKVEGVTIRNQMF